MNFRILIVVLFLSFSSFSAYAQEVTDLSKKAATLKIGKSTRADVVKLLGTPSWAYLPGDKLNGETMVDPKEALLLEWANGPKCGLVMATFDKRDVLIGIDQGRVGCSMGMGAYQQKSRAQATAFACKTTKNKLRASKCR